MKIETRLQVSYEDKRLAADSFCGRGLAIAGILIEVKRASDNKIVQMLIGTINESGGSCNDCRGIQDNDMVLRYTTIWQRSDETTTNE